MDSFKKKNSKGQVGFVAVMIGVLLILLGLALTPSLFETTNSDQVMGVDGLDCSNPNITNQDKAVCTSTDSTPMVYGFVIFGLAFMLFGRVAL